MRTANGKTIDIAIFNKTRTDILKIRQFEFYVTTDVHTPEEIQ